MRVLLTENVPKLGEVGDICDVAPGYGRNYLIPQGIAVLASAGALKQIDGLKRAEARRQDLVRAEMAEFGQRVARLNLEFTARVGETGRLYGSITSSDIAAEIEDKLGEEMDRRKIMLDESIRTLGEHVVPIHLMPGVDTQVTVNVIADDVEETGEPWLPPDADLGDDVIEAIDGEVDESPAEANVYGPTESALDASRADDTDVVGGVTDSSHDYAAEGLNETEDAPSGDGAAA